MLRVELGFHAWQLRASGFYGSGATWRFMGGYQWSYKSSNMDSRVRVLVEGG